MAGVAVVKALACAAGTALLEWQNYCVPLVLATQALKVATGERNSVQHANHAAMSWG